MHIFVSAAVILVIYFLFDSNRYIAHTASQQATKRLRSSCTLLQVATLAVVLVVLNSFNFAEINPKPGT